MADDQFDERQSDPCPFLKVHTGPRDFATFAYQYCICDHGSLIPNHANDECGPIGLNNLAQWAKRLCRMHLGRERLLGEL